MKKTSSENISSINLRKLFNFIVLLGLGSFYSQLVKAEQIANSSVDLKNEVENIKQKNFKNKDNLESPIKDSLNEEGEIRNKVSEKTILLKDISF